MDQRGYSVDPSEASLPIKLPATRVQAWAGLAARGNAMDLIPAQREHATA
ncbi:hypothetical protein [Cellulomonas sp. URHE0023]|nr:hypothetical protein [Cellulomonas sp. URHE0023]